MGDLNNGAEILIVEDSPTQAEQLKYILEEAGYLVSVASNGKVALSSISEHKPTLVISDIIMPEMDGYQLCQQIKAGERLKDIPVILVTFLSDPKDIIKGLNCGADHFVTKPYDKKYLLAQIHDIMANRELRKGQDLEMGIEIQIGGQKHLITSDRLQIVHLLISTYEAAVQQNQELIRARDELRSLNEQLEKKVKERTAKLVEEIEERKRVEEALRESITEIKDKEKKLTKSRDAFFNMLKDLDFSYRELKELYEGLIYSFVTAIDAKSPWTKGHSERVTNYAVSIARGLGLEEKDIEALRTAALLHDIGKIGTYDAILNKPGKLTDEEFALVKMHPVKGVEILRPVGQPEKFLLTRVHRERREILKPSSQIQSTLPVIRSHHERMDGKGYPDGLKGDEIPLLARIICVADSFDSMTSDRPYRPAPSKEYAVSELKKYSSTQFDPKVVEAFLRVFEKMK